MRLGHARSTPGSERARVLMELAIEKAHFTAQRTPTVLILDAEVSRLDARWMSRYAQHCVSPNSLYQTVLTLSVDEGAMDESPWSGWDVVRLVRTGGGVAVRQGPFRQNSVPEQESEGTGG